MRDEKDLVISCSNCEWFLSYQQAYEDDWEPDDCGYCQNSKRISTRRNVDGEEVCELHERLA